MKISFAAMIYLGFSSITRWKNRYRARRWAFRPTSIAVTDASYVNDILDRLAAGTRKSIGCYMSSSRLL
jgi:hypothetical protein